MIARESSALLIFETRTLRVGCKKGRGKGIPVKKRHSLGARAIIRERQEL